MALRRHGVDVATIALWLGHEDIRTTYGVYMHADLGLKEKALARTAPPATPAGRYRPPDSILEFLETYKYADIHQPRTTANQRR